MDDFGSTFGLVVEKDKVTAGGEYSLSGQRYRETIAASTTWPMRAIGEVCKINPQNVDPGELYPGSFFNYIDISSIENGSGTFLGTSKVEAVDAPDRAKRLVTRGDVLISTVRPNLRAFTILTNVPERAIASTGFAVLRPNPQQLLPEFLIYVVRDRNSVGQMVSMMGKGSYPSINQKDVASVQIPLPPLEVQQEIVAEIEGYQRVIDGARAVVENYRPHIVVDPEWSVVALGEICDIVRGSSPRPKGSSHFYGGPIPRLMVADITRDGMHSTPKIDSLTAAGAARSRPMNKGDVVITVSGNPGLPTILAVDACIHDGFVGLRNLREDVNCEYLYWNLLSNHQAHGLESVGAVFQNLTTRQVKEFKVPLPSLETQQAIVAEVQAEQALVEANRELIQRFEGKIHAAIGRVWSNVGQDGVARSR